MRTTTRTLALALVTSLLVLTGAGAAFGASIPVEPAGVDPIAFEPASACGCHGTLVEDWSVSMHAKALSDPIYRAKLDEAEKATDGKIGPFCLKCHGPGATMTGEFAAGAELSLGTNEGVNCSFCHQVTDLKAGVIGNTSHLVEPSGVRRAQIKDPKAPHPADYSELHTKAEFCGGCHNVLHPVNGMHLEATYKEWSESSYAKDGIVCQDCHMSTEPGVIGPTTGTAAPGAPERDNIYQMTFVGANVAQGPPAATALLKSAAEVKLDIPEIVAPGQTASATVTITNVGAGHKLPTGLTEVRQMWLEVTAATASGETTTFGTHVFGTILQDDKGNAPVELWEATKIKSDDRIAPRESVTYSYAFTMPEGATATSVTAALLYKSAPDELAEKAGVDNPTTEMAVASAAVYSDAEAAAQAATPAQGESESGTPSWVWFVVAGVIAAIGVTAVAWWRLRSAG